MTESDLQDVLASLVGARLQLESDDPAERASAFVDCISGISKAFYSYAEAQLTLNQALALRVAALEQRIAHLEGLGCEGTVH